MDLLDSIMKGMDKPPTTNKTDQQMKIKLNEHKEQLNKERELLTKFRLKIQAKITAFNNNEDNKCLQFPAMQSVFRTIIHDIADDAGLFAMSFGVEEVDRYITVYKKEFVPTEDEITARKNQEEWNEDTAKKYQELKKEAEMQASGSKESVVVKQTSNYQDKYRHLLGEDETIKTERNKVYGYVPSENKKDLRSIEQTLMDIQTKKKLKTQHTPTNTD